MLKYIINLSFFFMCSGMLLAEGTGIEFFHGSWEEAIQEAKAQEKLIFVDAYTTWCGPCKRMSANVFPEKEVGDFYNENFINLKLDMEKAEGISFRQNYRVNAFPTLLFIDGEGKLQHKHVGGLDVPRFVQLGKTALSKVDYSAEYATKYEDGERGEELLYNYARALLKSRKPSIKIANEYLRTQKDLNSKKNLEFIHAMALEADSRIFSLMLENEKEITKLVGSEAYYVQIEKACWNTVNKAIEFESELLLEEAKEKFKSHHNGSANTFALKADMTFQQAMGNEDEFIVAANKYLKKADNPGSEMQQLANEILNNEFPSKELLDAAEEWALASIKKSADHKWHITLVRVYLSRGKEREALQAARKALELAEAEKADTRMLQNWIRNLEENL